MKIINEYKIINSTVIPYIELRVTEYSDGTYVIVEID